MAARDLPFDQLETRKFELVAGLPAVRVLDTGGLNRGVQYDYVAVTYPTGTTEVYTFKNGGSGGTVVAIITLIYTDTTKVNLSSAERS